MTTSTRNLVTTIVVAAAAAAVGAAGVSVASAATSAPAPAVAPTPIVSESVVLTVGQTLVTPGEGAGSGPGKVSATMACPTSHPFATDFFGYVRPASSTDSLGDWSVVAEEGVRTFRPSLVGTTTATGHWHKVSIARAATTKPVTFTVTGDAGHAIVRTKLICTKL